MDLNIVLFW